MWTAVSSKPQLKRRAKDGEEPEDKESLANQLRLCVEVGNAHGWQDTGLRYVAPGQSRTRYVNLTDAEKDIPDLHDLLEDAKAGKYNLLILYDFNRLRSLMKPVKKVLESYGVQIYSVNQRNELQDPEKFNPGTSDDTMIGVHEVFSDLQVKDLRRKYETYVPQRLDRGLPALKIPYGYIRPHNGDSQSVPEIVPAQAAIVREIMQLFLDGMSLHKLRDHLDALGYPTPSGQAKWSRSTLKKILKNPYYAGKVRWQDRLTVRDFRDNTARLINNPTPILKDGKHQPLYSWEIYQQILLEIERRSTAPRLSVYQLTGLLSCAVCGNRLYHHGTSKETKTLGLKHYRYWWCKSGHVKIYEAHALALVSKSVTDALKNATLTDVPRLVPDTQAAMDELDAKRKKIQADYESEIYTKAEAVEKMNAIKAKKKLLMDEAANTTRKQQQRQNFIDTLKKVRTIPNINNWMRDADPAEVSKWLRDLCSISITPEHKATVHFRA